MNRPLATILIATSLALCSSCGGEDDGRTGNAQTNASEGSSPQAHGTESGLRLDDGKKWKANEATHLGMGKMRSLLADFDASETKDYAALGESLEAETDIIIRECDMTGEPHEQLHLVLNPILEAIHKLAAGDGGSDECQALRQHLAAYHSHFEL